MAATRTTRRPAGVRSSRSRRRSRRSPWPRRFFALAAVIAVGLGIYAIAAGPFEKAVREFTLPLRHEDIIRQQAEEKQIDAALIAAVIYTESRFRDQTSSADARGLMQITPDTALDIARRSEAQTFVLEDLRDPQINISYGTYHLRDLIGWYDGNLVAALAAYNAGPGRVDEWGGSDLTIDDIEFEETRGYVAQVLDKRDDYRRTYARELGY